MTRLATLPQLSPEIRICKKKKKTAVGEREPTTNPERLAILQSLVNVQRIMERALLYGLDLCAMAARLMETAIMVTRLNFNNPN